MANFMAKAGLYQVARLLGSPLKSHNTSLAKAKANAARDRGEFAEAALLYEAALREDPLDAGIHIQCGHMHKEAGDLAKAEPHYLEALSMKPKDADLHLQLGHFYKVAGQIDKSMSAYERACMLAPGWAEPLQELELLRHRYGRETPTGPNGKAPLALAKPSRPAVFIERIQPSVRRSGA